jgi:hypothetical protein
MFFLWIEVESRPSTSVIGRKIGIIEKIVRTAQVEASSAVCAD